MKKIFIHVGYHKTSSTFLQTKIFPFFSDVEYLGTHYKKAKTGILDFFEKSANGETDRLRKSGVAADFAYAAGTAPSLSMCSKLISTFIDMVEKSSSEKVMISSEDFLRPLFYEEMAVFVAEILSNYEIEIVMVLREQRSIILSRYSHDMKAINFRYSLKDALSYESNIMCYYPVCRRMNRDVACVCDQVKVKPIYMSFYNFDSVHETLCKYFSKVHIVLYESLYGNTDNLKALLQVFDTSFVDGFDLGAAFSRKVGDRSEGEKNRVAIDAIEMLGDLRSYYRSGNEKLAGKFPDLDFEKYGYL